MSSRAMVLVGLLLDRPRHGYELKAVLSPALPRRQQINDGILYPLLNRLEKDGLITGELVPQEGTPAKRVYHVTDAGREAFRDWLAGPSEEADEIPYDFLVHDSFLSKALFFGQLEEAVVRQKLRVRLGSSRQKLEELKRIRAGVEQGQAQRNRYFLALMDLGITQQQAQIEWLTRLLAGRLPPEA